MRLRLQNQSDGSQIGVYNAAPRSFLQSNYDETFHQTMQAIKTRSQASRLLGWFSSDPLYVLTWHCGFVPGQSAHLVYTQLMQEYSIEGLCLSPSRHLSGRDIPVDYFMN